ncbi:ParB family chromosome partitioning protein [Sphingomonas sp. SORGH_AS 950]|uniref:ParB/RepB/Spo0J family partition protein n=1 Tax=Sphingomonas sp. SORGH_AS_0950 TaxID=3041792 RepID=UPI002782E43E|nr:ParB N-terminal domain-containing protein [Sphingomonas sp. SORGH_AS_0950]MDQ1158913.1 ParB family chromosome partitioning protein [Sphingomonas sp. SORGH_AS_0950]
MELANIDLGKLFVSKTNMRHADKTPDVSDILPTVQARGIIVPLIVRRGDDEGRPDSFAIIAGARRFRAATLAAEESGEADPVPCAIMAPGDDAAALEASLIENIARLDPDEVTQWTTFTRLVKEGRSVEQIGQTFGLTDLYVRRILALGNLLPRIRDLYRAEKIDAASVRHLTLATKAQQKRWLALFDSEDDYCPTGPQLKSWVCGGAAIPVTSALFPLDGYKGKIIADLFGENGYFADAEHFWTAQNEAIAARIDAYKADGWRDVELLEPGRYFHRYEHEKVAKADGGKVFVTVHHNGEVEFHEGYLTGKDAKKARAKTASGINGTAAGADLKPADTDRPETTSGLQRYVDLHRHAAVRAVLLDHPGAALRLMVAHAINGSVLWTVKAADQRSGSDATDESLETSLAETLFDARRRAVLGLLGFSPDDLTVTGGGDTDLATVFARLLALEDAQVLDVAAIVMGETLAVTSPMVDLLGTWLKVDMADFWQADDAFLDQLRDRKIVNAMLRQVAGKKVSDANLIEKVKTQKAIIRDCLAGANQRKKVDNWVPKWLAFPPAAYAGRPLPTLDRWREVATLAKTLPAPLDAAPPAAAADATEPDGAVNHPAYPLAA